jgi:hypothetical protein
MLFMNVWKVFLLFIQVYQHCHTNNNYVSNYFQTVQLNFCTLKGKVISQPFGNRIYD